jgi:CBS domain-containing protein
MSEVKAVHEARIVDIMTTEVVTVTEGTTIKDLRDMFDRYDFNAFPVLRGERVVGIVTKMDLLRAFHIGRSASHGSVLDLFADRVGDIMRRAVMHLGPEDSVGRAVEYMLEFKLRSLPVIDQGKLVGMLAMKDILPYLAIDRG